MADFKLSDEQRKKFLEKDKEHLVEIIEKSRDLIESAERVIEKKNKYINGLERAIDTSKKLEDILNDQIRILQEEVAIWRLLSSPSASSLDN